MDRLILIKDKEYNNQQIDRVPIILDYNVQHRQVERIIQRHWHMLQADKHLHTILPNKPKFVYKKAPTIQDNLVKSVIDSPKKSFTFFTGKCFYPCKKCYACTRTKLPMKESFTLHQPVQELHIMLMNL